MTQGENITIESGTGLGGNVKPVEILDLYHFICNL